MSTQTLEERLANLEAMQVDDGTKKLRARREAERANAEEAEREAEREMREIEAAKERFRQRQAAR